jgi:hypothetical protein
MIVNFKAHEINRNADPDIHINNNNKNLKTLFF